MKFEITGSIVIYKNAPAMLKRAIESFLGIKGFNIRLFLIDNSPTNEMSNLCFDHRCEYIFTGMNLGFGRGHNIALRRAIDCSKFHLVLNPDVYFDEGKVESMIEYMERNPDVGQLMPKILYPNGELQYSGKLLPTPLDLILRRLFTKSEYAKKKNRIFELRDSGYDQILNVPNHLGCFMLTKIDAYKKAGLFDERLFMYNEDVDITRRIHEHYKTIFYPKISVFHHYEKGSHKNIKLLYYHIESTICYFNKWGWFFDAERKSVNKSVLDKIYTPKIF
jgi:GT2 family glycosyltransferase